MAQKKRFGDCCVIHFLQILEVMSKIEDNRGLGIDRILVWKSKQKNQFLMFNFTQIEVSFKYTCQLFVSKTHSWRCLQRAQSWVEARVDEPVLTVNGLIRSHYFTRFHVILRLRAKTMSFLNFWKMFFQPTENL